MVYCFKKRVKTNPFDCQHGPHSRKTITKTKKGWEKEKLGCVNAMHSIQRKETCNTILEFCKFWKEEIYILSLDIMIKTIRIVTM